MLLPAAERAERQHAGAWRRGYVKSRASAGAPAGARRVASPPGAAAPLPLPRCHRSCRALALPTVMAWTRAMPSLCTLTGGAGWVPPSAPLSPPHSLLSMLPMALGSGLARSGASRRREKECSRLIWAPAALGRPAKDASGHRGPVREWRDRPGAQRAGVRRGAFGRHPLKALSRCPTLLSHLPSPLSPCRLQPRSILLAGVCVLCVSSCYARVQCVSRVSCIERGERRERIKTAWGSWGEGAAEGGQERPSQGSTHM